MVKFVLSTQPVIVDLKIFSFVIQIELRYGFHVRVQLVTDDFLVFEQPTFQEDTFWYTIVVCSYLVRSRVHYLCRSETRIWTWEGFFNTCYCRIIWPRQFQKTTLGARGGSWWGVFLWTGSVFWYQICTRTLRAMSLRRHQLNFMVPVRDRPYFVASLIYFYFRFHTTQFRKVYKNCVKLVSTDHSTGY